MYLKEYTSGQYVMFSLPLSFNFNVNIGMNYSNV